MNTITKLSMFSIIAVTVACGGGDDSRADGDTGDTGEPAESSGGESSGGMTSSPTTTSPTTTSPTTTSDPDTGETTTGGDDPFMFEEGDPGDYAQIDRMGMPAVATAVITDKDDYNAATPTDDAAGTFVEQIVGNLTGLHAALDDDLMGAGLTPCAIDTCVAQAAPLVVPDVLHVDFTGAAGFPNGRRPADPVVDITLAVVLLDLGVHSAATLAELPLNPPAGDVEPPAEFPYFAAPH